MAWAPVTRTHQNTHAYSHYSTIMFDYYSKCSRKFIHSQRCVAISIGHSPRGLPASRIAENVKPLQWPHLLNETSTDAHQRQYYLTSHVTLSILLGGALVLFIINKKRISVCKKEINITFLCRRLHEIWWHLLLK